MGNEPLLQRTRTRYCCLYPFTATHGLLLLAFAIVLLYVYLVVSAPSVPAAGNPEAYLLVMFGIPALVLYAVVTFVVSAFCVTLTLLLSRIHWRNKCLAFFAGTTVYILGFFATFLLLAIPFFAQS